MRACLQQRGEEAALTLGLSLGLREATARAYIVHFKRTAQSKAHAPTTRARTLSKQKVYDIGAPKRLGTLLTAGEQVSEVKWDHSGLTQFVSNDYLRPAKEK